MTLMLTNWYQGATPTRLVGLWWYIGRKIPENKVQHNKENLSIYSRQSRLWLVNVQSALSFVANLNLLLTGGLATWTWFSKTGTNTLMTQGFLNSTQAHISKSKVIDLEVCVFSESFYWLIWTLPSYWKVPINFILSSCPFYVMFRV